MRKKWVKSILVVSMIFCFLFQQTVLAAEEAGIKDVEYLKSVMEMIKEKYRGEVTERQLIEGALKGMFDTMDPYTTYFTQNEASGYMDQVNGSYVGIGVTLTSVSEYIVVSKVFPSSPAEKAGIVNGDRIVDADGVSLAGKTTSEASDLIRGEEGTSVVLGILRSGKDQVVKLEVNRENIKISPVGYKIEGDTGYIKLEMFNANADWYIMDALERMEENGIEKIILDLRDNPGGQVAEAVSIARRFVPKGLITKLDFKSESIKDKAYYSYLKKPKYKLVVLVNEGSASASEILAGAIQDTKAGTLVGTKTFGKAKVQSMFPILTPEAFQKYEKELGVKLVDGYDLVQNYDIKPKDSEILGWTKITTGEYTTPNGRMIDLQGITPDVVVRNISEDMSIANVQRLSEKIVNDYATEGVDVINAEKILKMSGYEVDTPDMELDDKAVKALQQFQKDVGLNSYGKLDIATQQALNRKLKKLTLIVDSQYAKALQLLKD